MIADHLDRQAFERVVLAIAATLSLHVEHLPPWMSITLAATIALRVVARRRAVGIVSAWLRVPLTAALLVFVATHYGNVFGRVPGTTLACAMLGL